MFFVVANLWRLGSTSIFWHKWHHLSSLPYQFSIFENVGVWQPCTVANLVIICGGSRGFGAGSVKCTPRTIVFRVRKQWHYCCHIVICMVKTIVRSLRFALTGVRGVRSNPLNYSQTRSSVLVANKLMNSFLDKWFRLLIRQSIHKRNNPTVKLDLDSIIKCWFGLWSKSTCSLFLSVVFNSICFPFPAVYDCVFHCL